MTPARHEWPTLRELARIGYRTDTGFGFWPMKIVVWLLVIFSALGALVALVQWHDPARFELGLAMVLLLPIILALNMWIHGGGK